MDEMDDGYIDSDEVEALRVARKQALARVTRAFNRDDFDLNLLDRLWVEYRAAHEAYMEALGWDPDDHCGV